MSLGETIGALGRVGAGRLATCVAVGLAVGVGICLALIHLLPEDLVRSLLPYAAGAAGGLAACLAIGALRERALLAPLILVAIAIAVATAYLCTILIIAPDALEKRVFGYWSPSVASISLAVWIAAAIWERRVGRRLAAFTAIIAGMALSAALLNNGSTVYRALSGDYLRSWNVYHYYVGAKYFRELGYTDLYAATLEADDERLRVKHRATPEEWARLAMTSDFADIEETRSMLTYARIPREEAVAGFDRDRFSESRWIQLGRDTRSLRPHLDSKAWKGVLTDLGFNPSPAWTVVGTPIANLVPIDRPASWIVANSDLPLLLLMFGFVWWAFGPRAAFMALLWMNAIHFNRARFAGGFLQYDWLVSMVIGFALYHKGRGVAAGAVYSWGLMTRAFPAFLVIPIAAKLVIGLVRERRLDPHKTRFFAALLLCCGLIFGLSHLTGRGLASWPEWVDKIGRHGHLHPVMDPQRIGVGRLVLHEPDDEDPWGEAAGVREERLEVGQTLKWVIQGLGLLLLAAALIKRRDEDAMVLMLFAVFLVLTLSRYYASSWILLFMLEARPVGAGRNHLGAVLAGGFLLLMGAVFYVADTRAGRYFLVNYEALGMFVALCAVFIEAALRARSKSRSDPTSSP
jgi:hypothetical protein